MCVAVDQWPLYRGQNWGTAINFLHCSDVSLSCAPPQVLLATLQCTESFYLHIFPRCRIVQDSHLYYKPIVWQHRLFLVFYLWFQYFIDFLKCQMWNVKHKIQLIYTEGIFREQKIPDVGATDRDRYSRVMINFHSIIAHVQTVLGTLSRPCNAQHQYQSIPNRDYGANARSQWIN